MMCDVALADALMGDFYLWKGLLFSDWRCARFWAVAERCKQPVDQLYRFFS